MNTRISHSTRVRPSGATSHDRGNRARRARHLHRGRRRSGCGCRVGAGAGPCARREAAAARSGPDRRLVRGEVGVSMMTRVRGISNAKAVRELGWQPRYPSYRESFRAGMPDLTAPGCPHGCRGVISDASPIGIRKSRMRAGARRGRSGDGCRNALELVGGSRTATRRPPPRRLGQAGRGDPGAGDAHAVSGAEIGRNCRERLMSTSSRATARTLGRRAWRPALARGHRSR